jgi:hypothetical protein
MSILVVRDDIKRKCRIALTDTTYDSDIDNLISEVQPGIEYTIADTYLSNISDINLQKILKLGIIEIISGEFLRQLLRESGSSESFSVGGITIGAASDHGGKLIEQGNARLQPFRKAIDGMTGEASVLSSTLNKDMEFAINKDKVW